MSVSFWPHTCCADRHSGLTRRALAETMTYDLAITGRKHLAQSTDAAAAQEWQRHWPLVLAGVSGMSLSSLSTSSFGVMMVPLTEALGWSRSLVSLGPLTLTVTVILVGTAMGYAVDKFGSRIVALISAALLCGAIAAMSQLTPSPLLWLLIWVVIGVGSAAMPTVSVTPVSRSLAAPSSPADASPATNIGLASEPALYGRELVGTPK